MGREMDTPEEPAVPGEYTLELTSQATAELETGLSAVEAAFRILISVVAKYEPRIWDDLQPIIQSLRNEVAAAATDPEKNGSYYQQERAATADLLRYADVEFVVPSGAPKQTR